VVGSDARVWLTELLGGTIGREDLRALLHLSRTLQAGRGQTVLRPDDDLVLFVLRGTAKVHAPRAHGDEVITALLGPGDSHGLLAALGHGAVATQVTALHRLEGLLVPGPQLRGALPGLPGLELACLRAVARQHAQASDERLRFAGTSVAQRVCLRLVELADRWGEPVGSAVEVRLPLTQEELAAWCGSSRESVSKVLHTLRRAGMVRTGRRSLCVLDLGRLRERCEPHATVDGDRELVALIAQLA